MAEPIRPINRRALLGAGALLLTPGLARAALPPGRRLAFSISRNGAHIGEHQMTFAGDAAAPVVTTEVSMVVKLGPVPVYRYRHHAVERWSAGRFQSLETTTDSNGKPQAVSAHRGDGGLVIESTRGRVVGPADAVPFTHWNPEAFGDPLFNPQEGKMLKVQVARAGAGHWAVRGEAEIDDYYDAEGVWRALKGKLKDGSMIEYRRT